ncbi:Alpha/Beta hydrolase protein [Exophiala viscosa]|uniref:Alpha/Beta hydrolase protein n=1 Tax=Exophiala viscosa TaxID=2486360 RepID=UPI00219CF5E7|nr:Alpha/Beta hydrolase protein [Exophiala viscosa]
MMAPSATSNRYITPNGTDVHYISSGKQQGRVAVLLHGLGGSTETFRDLLPIIPPDYHIISVDIEGFGKTLLNQEEPLSFSRYVSDLHDLITHVQERPSASTSGAVNGASSNNNSSEEPVLLVGHSLGAIISLQYAARFPSQVAGLLLLGSGRSVRGIPPAQQRMRDLAKAARQKGMYAVADIALMTNFPADRGNDGVHDEEVRKAVSSCSAEAYAATAELAASDDHHDPDYSMINCPAVFVAGDKDMISPPQRSEDISKLVGGPSEVVVVESGHQMILQDIEGVKGALDKLLQLL